MHHWIVKIKIVLFFFLSINYLYSQDNLNKGLDSLIKIEKVAVSYKRNSKSLCKDDLKKFDSIISVVKQFQSYYVALKIENEVGYTPADKVSLYNKRLKRLKLFFVNQNIVSDRIRVYEVNQSTQISESQLLKLKEYRKDNINIEDKPFNIIVIISK